MFDYCGHGSYVARLAARGASAKAGAEVARLVDTNCDWWIVSQGPPHYRISSAAAGPLDVWYILDTRRTRVGGVAQGGSISGSVGTVASIDAACWNGWLRAADGTGVEVALRQVKTCADWNWDIPGHARGDRKARARENRRSRRRTPTSFAWETRACQPRRAAARGTPARHATSEPSPCVLTIDAR